MIGEGGGAVQGKRGDSRGARWRFADRVGWWGHGDD
jgi:hypothetical protein